MRPIGFVDDVQSGELGVVVRHEMAVALLLPVLLVAVERHESLSELIRRGVRRVVVESDICIVEAVFVVDMPALEDTGDICLALEVGLCKISCVHNSNFSGLDMWCRRTSCSV